MEEDDEDMEMQNEIDLQNAASDFFRFFLVNTIAVVMITLEYDYVMGVPHPLIPDLRFDPTNLGTGLTFGLQSEHLFRFNVDQLHILVDALRMPAFLWTPERDALHAIEGLCIVLRRLVFPVRYMDMVQLFGRSRAALSRINRYVMVWLYMRWHHLSEFHPEQVILHTYKIILHACTKHVMHLIA